MDIAAMSTMLSQAKIQQQASLSIVKTAMNTAKMQGTDLLQLLEVNTKIMEQSVNPHIGSNVDVTI